MQYLATLYDVESGAAEPGSPEWDDELAAYGAFDEKYGAAVRGGEALYPSALTRTVRGREGGDGAPLITDGPFAETAEVIGGYYVLEAGSLDEVIEQASAIPAASTPTGAVEVRPVVMAWEPEQPVEKGPDDTRYMAVILGGESAADVPGTPEWDAGAAEHGRFTEKHAGALMGGVALHPAATATVVRVRDGQTLVTDGPFAEASEVIGGLYVLRAASPEEAAEVAADVPVNPGGAVEVRPIVEIDGP